MKTRIGNLKATALACLLSVAAAAVQATSPISGIWRTNDGSYLMTVRDANAVVVGVEIGPDLKVRDIYTGTRLREPLSVLALGDGQKQINIETVTDLAMSGTRSSGQVFTATRILSYKDAGINGVWKRDDGNLGYLFVFNGDGENGGTGVVSEIFFQNGKPQHLLALGKISGNAFADTSTGFRLLLQPNGKLAGEYGYNLSDTRADLESGEASARSVARATSSSSNPNSYTATRVLTGKEPDVGSGTGAGGIGSGTGGIGSGTGGIGGSTNVGLPGCAGSFGDLQTTIKDNLTASMTERGLSPGWIVSKTKIGDVRVFDGGSVPNYRITYVTDAGTNLSKTLAKSSEAQSVYISCLKSTSLYASTATYGTTEQSAREFCSSVETGAASLNPQHAFLSARGMNAEEVIFDSVNTNGATSGKVPLVGRVYIDTDGTFGMPAHVYYTSINGSGTTEVKSPSGQPESYQNILSSCKGWYESGKTAANPYPSWFGSKPAGTPTFAICIDPDSNIAQTPGLFAVSIKGGGTTNTGHNLEPYLNHTTEVDLSQVVPYQFTSTDPETGKTQIMVTKVPIHLVKKVASATDVLDPNISSYCYFDKEAELWFGLGGTEPHTEACKTFNTQFRQQFKDNAYNGLYVTKANIALPNGDTQSLTPAEGMSVGMGLMAGAGLGVLGIGGFEPSGNTTNASVGLDASSTAKFISLTPYVKTTTSQECYSVPADPETGEPAHTECATVQTNAPTRQIAYTIEAPSCEP